jgi:hypothetical protein
MKKTRPSTLVALFLFGAGAGWIIETVLVASGRPTLIPPFTLGAVFVLIGVVVVLLALPVFRVVRKSPGARVDPFYATRVVLLAKASSLAGSLVTGLSTGALIYLLTRSVSPAVGSVAMSISTLVGAVLLLVGGLVAEKMCTLPPEDDNGRDTAPDPAHL